ncbi:MAG: hypothetical protein ACLFRG_05680 [Desulfococcaceae bacterium]
MESKNGTAYHQNYDLVVKLMGGVLKGRTREAIGLESGRIEEVFGFEPADISVRSGRIDLMVRDEQGRVFHSNCFRRKKFRSVCWPRRWSCPTS